MSKSLNQLSRSVTELLNPEIEKLMLTEGKTKSEATIIASQFVIAPGIAYTAVAMGKQELSQESVRKITHQILDLVAELP